MERLLKYWFPLFFHMKGFEAHLLTYLFSFLLHLLSARTNYSAEARRANMTTTELLKRWHRLSNGKKILCHVRHQPPVEHFSTDKFHA